MTILVQIQIQTCNSDEHRSPRRANTKKYEFLTSRPQSRTQPDKARLLSTSRGQNAPQRPRTQAGSTHPHHHEARHVWPFKTLLRRKRTGGHVVQPVLHANLVLRLDLHLHSSWRGEPDRISSQSSCYAEASLERCSQGNPLSSQDP